MEPFGVIVPCHAGDLWMARACLESVAHFAQGTPLCLLVDGSLRVEPATLPPGTRVLYRSDLPEPLLRDPSRGCHLKMAALLHSPFARFLMIDADALMWGDVTQRVRTVGAFQIHGPWEGATDARVCEYFFDTAMLAQVCPEVPWDARQLGNGGVWAADRGVVTLRDLEWLMALRDAHPGLFKMPEQGYLNFLMQKLQAEGRVRVLPTKLQHIVVDHPLEETALCFSVPDRGPPSRVTPPAATVLHYAGTRKPWYGEERVWHPPMTCFRMQALRRRGSLRCLPPSLALRWEDYITRKESRRSLGARVNRRAQILAEWVWRHSVGKGG